MAPRGRAARAAALGSLLFLLACAVPTFGLFRGELGTSLFRSYGERVLDGEIPYRDFSLEYPPGALPAFVVPALGGADDYDTWFMAFQAACGLGCVVLVALVTGRRLAVAYCALAPLALGPLVLHRYDLWATLLALAGLAALLAGRLRLGAAALGAGAAAKVFPVVLLPLAVARRGRRTLAWFVAALAVLVGPFMLLGPGGIRFSVEGQVERGLQIESLGASILLVLDRVGAYTAKPFFGDGSWNLDGATPDALAVASSIVQLGTLAAVWIVYARGQRTDERLVLAAAAALAASVTFGKVLSPQFLVWLLPFVSLLPSVRPAVLLLGALALTQVVYPGRYDALVDVESLPVVVLAARNALLLTLTASLVVALQRDGITEEVPRQRERREPREPVVLDGGERDDPHGVPRLEPGRGEHQGGCADAEPRASAPRLAEQPEVDEREQE